LIQASAAGLNQVEQFVWCGNGDDATCAMTWSNCWVLRGFISSSGPEGVKDAD